MIRPKVHVSSATLLAHCCEMPAKRVAKECESTATTTTTTTGQLIMQPSRRTQSKQVGVAMQCNARQDDKQKRKV
jgi:hypothetical protein